MGRGISYNLLNLPATVSQVGSSATLASYTYDAGGTKLHNSGSDGSWDYINGIVYHNNAVEFISTEEGRVKLNAGVFSYEYNLQDHLGNNRVSFDRYGGVARVIQEDEYYSFGLRKAVGGYDLSNNNRYLYNGKELQTDLSNQYDYGARFYDPVVGRFGTVDPMAEDFDHLSPYNYAVNNPMLMIDPDGMSADTTGKAIAPPLILPGIALKEVAISAVRTIANAASQGLDYLAAGLSSTAVGAGTFVGAMALPGNYQQKWQYRDYGLPRLPPPYIPSIVKSEKKEKAGSGTPRKKSTPELRKEWEDATDLTWPNEPGNPKRKQVAHHKVPLADGGYDGMPNIEPRPSREHTDLHKNNGDFKRWRERRGNN